MTFKVPIFWHHALSPIHRKVAIASFLQAVRHRGAVLYYPPGDEAIASIREAATAVGLPACVIIDWSYLATHARAETWVWIGSHGAPDDIACRALARGQPPPMAILCLNPDAEGFQRPELPPGHQPFVT